MTPKTVYLDTQDYSRIADAVHGRGDASLIPVYEKLREFARAGEYRFCFSYMIVSELLQFDPNGLDIARRKAAVVEELCGGNAFPTMFWMLASEIAGAGKRRGFEPSRQMSTLDEVAFGGQWVRTELPDIETMFPKESSGQTRYEKRAEELVGRRLNRRERRKLARPQSAEDVRNVILSSPIYPIIAGTPLFPKFVDAFRRKRMPEVAADFFRFVGKPTRLVLSHDHLHPMGFLNDQLKTLRASLHHTLTTLREKFDRIAAESGRAAPRETREAMLSDVLQEQVVNLPKSLKEFLVRHGAPPAYFDHPDFNQDIRELSFMATWHDLLLPYLLMVTDASPGRRGLRESDIVDFMHALYMPHCAVWRSDRYFVGLVAPIARRLGCQVVSRLADLPDVLAVARDERGVA